MDYLDIKTCGPKDEPMCATSEPGERLFSRDEIRSVGFDISRRLLEVFGHHDIPNIVFRLRSTACEVRSVLSGNKMPSIEFLLALRDQTGVSIDWVLTGVGPKFQPGALDMPAVRQRPETPTVIAFPTATSEPLAA
jgi:hypothetical protein